MANPLRNISNIAKNIINSSPAMSSLRGSMRSLSSIKGPAQSAIDILRGKTPMLDNTPYLEQVLGNTIAQYNPLAYVRGIEEIPNSIKYHVDNVSSGLKNFKQAPLAGLGSIGDLAFDIAGTAYPLYSAFSDREDLDTAGTMENAFARGANVISALAFTQEGVKHIMPHGFMAQLPLMLLAPGMEAVMQGVGRKVDDVLGTGPTAKSVEGRFVNRVKNRIGELQGGNMDFTTMPNPNITQQAVNDVLANGQDYLKYINS